MFHHDLRSEREISLAPSFVRFPRSSGQSEGEMKSEMKKPKFGLQEGGRKKGRVRASLLGYEGRPFGESVPHPHGKIEGLEGSKGREKIF